MPGDKPLQLAGCAIIHGRNLLLLHRTEQNHYEFPGGKVEPGEDLETAARREVREELGIEVKIIRFLSSLTFTNPKTGNRHESHIFLAEGMQNKEPRVMEPEKFDHIQWIPMEKYQEFPLAPNAREFCEKWMKGEFSEKKKISYE